MVFSLRHLACTLVGPWAMGHGPPSLQALVLFVPSCELCQEHSPHGRILPRALASWLLFLLPRAIASWSLDLNDSVQ